MNLDELDEMCALSFIINHEFDASIGYTNWRIEIRRNVEGKFLGLSKGDMKIFSSIQQRLLVELTKWFLALTKSFTT